MKFYLQHALTQTGKHFEAPGSPEPRQRILEPGRMRPGRIWPSRTGRICAGESSTGKIAFGENS